MVRSLETGTCTWVPELAKQCAAGRKSCLIVSPPTFKHFRPHRLVRSSFSELNNYFHAFLMILALTMKPDKNVYPIETLPNIFIVLQCPWKGTSLVNCKAWSQQERKAGEEGGWEGGRMVSKTECTYASKVNYKTARGNSFISFWICRLPLEKYFLNLRKWNNTLF